MGHLIEKVIAYIADVGLAMASLVVLAMGIIVGLGTITRYAFNFILLSLDEYSAYGLIFIVFMSIGWIMKQDSHIKVELLLNKLPLKINRGLQFFNCLFGFFVAAAYFKFAWDYFLNSVRLHRLSISVAATPLAIIHSFVWIGWFIFIMVLIIHSIKTFHSFRESLRAGGAAGASEPKKKMI